VKGKNQICKNKNQGKMSSATTGELQVHKELGGTAPGKGIST